MEFDMPVRARHFPVAVYGEIDNCPLSIAANEYFYSKDAIEGCKEMFVKGMRLQHRYYNVDNFRYDSKQAEVFNYDDTVIRTIKLKVI